ncbi:hypothetical protein V8D89_001782 [Ganoderma adspersum]
MATGTTSLTIHAPTPRPASSIMLNIPSTLSNASVQASQPPKPSIAPRPPPAPRTAHLTRLETRQLLREKVTAAVHRRLDGPKNTNTTTFPPPPRRAGRSNLTTAPRLQVPLNPTVALHNAERRISLIPSREKYFRTRPRPAARGKRILSGVPVLLENEVYPPPPAPPVLHPMVRTKASRPRPRPRRSVADENTVPFPTETPALPSALPKARRTVRAASCSLPRPPFAQLSM